MKATLHYGGKLALYDTETNGLGAHKLRFPIIVVMNALCANQRKEWKVTTQKKLVTCERCKKRLRNLECSTRK
jgi:hypothetical protein